MKPGVCADCKFWEKLQGQQGGCRRYPPAVHSRMEDQYVGASPDRHTVLMIESTFPQTEADSWCGEFQQRPTPLADHRDT